MGTTTHTVRSFDRELHDLTGHIVAMGELAAAQVDAAVTLLLAHNGHDPQTVVAGDGPIDRLQHETETLAIRELALRQPKGEDLRLVVSAVHAASDLERIGDAAKTVALHGATLAKLPALGFRDEVSAMAAEVQAMTAEAVAAFRDENPSAAMAVWRRDEAVDAQLADLTAAVLQKMTEGGAAAVAGHHLLCAAKALERVGDHATNIAENVLYRVRGRMPEGERPKSEAAKTTTPVF